MNAVFSRAGALSFTGSGGPVEVAPTSDLALDAATIAFTFNADRVDGTRGLVSKDASGYGDGGHLSAWIKNGVLNVRFQDEDSSRTLRADGIVANRDYDVVLNFDAADGVQLFVDGQLEGADSRFLMSWANNDEFLQIGALGWTSRSGDDNFSNAFDGEISNVTIYDEALTPDELAGGSQGSTNREPVANDDQATVRSGQSVTIDVRANDTDADGDALAITAADQTTAGGGSVRITADGRIAYTAADSFTGTDSFDYTIADGEGGTATATVRVDVTAAPPPPPDDDPSIVFSRAGTLSFGQGVAPTLLFVGSSTIDRWNTASDFAEYNVVNLGISGYTLGRMLRDWNDRFADSVPDGNGAIIFYNGENDIANGRSVAEVVDTFEDLRELQGAGDDGYPPLVWLDVKESPRRSSLGDEFQDLNEAIAALGGDDVPEAIVDTNQVALGAGGAPDPSKFSDGLHFDADAYDELTVLVKSELDDLGIRATGGATPVVVAPNSDLELDAATIAFTFNADRVDGTRGLVSKDASGYGGGGHLSVWITNGVLNVRFQDEDSSRTLSVDGIIANRDYDVVLNFDAADGAQLFVDGQLEGADSRFLVSWVGNDEFLQIGALGWTSRSGDDSFNNAFDGEIEDFAIYDDALTPAEIAAASDLLVS